MDFLSNLHTDVKLLLVAGALALLAALLSGTKRNEHRFVALFTLLMLGAGYRLHVHEREDQALVQAEAGAEASAQPATKAGGTRAKAR
jgi:hypothetical protein